MTDTLRMLSYTWDQIGNLDNRTVNLQEPFTFDNLDRVTQSQTTTGQDVITTTVAYDALGNITHGARRLTNRHTCYESLTLELARNRQWA